MHSLMLTDTKDRDDIRVMKLSRGPSLALETLQVRRAEPAVEGQHLQGHVSSQRLLDRFVDQAHAAAAHFTQDAVVAQPRRDPPGSKRRHLSDRRADWRPFRKQGSGRDSADQPGTIQFRKAGVILVYNGLLTAAPAIMDFQKDQFAQEIMSPRSSERGQRILNRRPPAALQSGFAGNFEGRANLIDALIEGEILLLGSHRMAHARSSWAQRPRIMRNLRSMVRREQSSLAAISSLVNPSIFQMAIASISGSASRLSKSSYSSATLAANSGDGS